MSELFEDYRRHLRSQLKFTRVRAYGSAIFLLAYSWLLHALWPFAPWAPASLAFLFLGLAVLFPLFGELGIRQARRELRQIEAASD